MLPRRAIASNLDALAEAWEWTGDDVVAHGLPLFHVHGLILGMLGPVRRGGGVHHLGRFSRRGRGGGAERGRDDAVRASRPCTTGVAAEAEQDRELCRALGNARLLVSGSAALPAIEHERIERLTGQQIAERYGMTETLMNTGVRASGERRPGYVGPPLNGVELRLVDDDGGTDRRRRRRDDRRDPRARPEPVPRVPQPPGRHRRGDDRTAGSRPATSRRARPTATSGSSAAAPPT